MGERQATRTVDTLKSRFSRQPVQHGAGGPRSEGENSHYGFSDDTGVEGFLTVELSEFGDSLC